MGRIGWFGLRLEDECGTYYRCNIESDTIAPIYIYSRVSSFSFGWFLGLFTFENAAQNFRKDLVSAVLFNNQH